MATEWFGYVYLLQCGDQYKIGYSTKPRKRLKQMRTGSPYPIYLVHTLRTVFYCAIEKQLHLKFREKRGLGEWFTLNDEDVAYIKSLNKHGCTPEQQEEFDRRDADRRKEGDAAWIAECRAEAQQAIAMVAAV